MPERSADLLIIGGGIVGLATALDAVTRLPELRLIVLEKENQVAAHQTGHNSGVIHAGVYYAPGSLKARLCREGNQQTRQFCLEHGIRFELCGKLIVATNAEEDAMLAGIKRRAEANDVEGMCVLTADEAIGLEPNLSCTSALLSPITRIRQVEQRARPPHMLACGTL